MKRYANAVVIGRFQPFHREHLKLIQTALDYADRVCLVIGSGNQPRTIKNPFTANERASMILETIREETGVSDLERINWMAVEDNQYDDIAWATQVRTVVDVISTPGSTILVGCNKDSSSYYLNMFPEWKQHFVQQRDSLSATQVRDMLFGPTSSARAFGNLGILNGALPCGTRMCVKEFLKTPEYRELCDEYDFIEKYKKQFASMPYTPTFVTADAVVVCSGHVLMVRRGASPGRGLWALPGGFLNAETDPSMLDCAIRELFEETQIDLTPNIVRSRLINQGIVFDAIDRSLRGRTITHAFYFQLKDGLLPKVKGSDDAVDAAWIRLSSLDRSKIFEDHYDIIKKVF